MNPVTATNSRLLADIGGTNARFALAAADGSVTQIEVLRSIDHAGVAEAAESYLAGIRTAIRPTEAIFAVASPVTGDSIAFTNSAWSFSVAAIRKRLRLTRLDVINDFVAVARAVPHLTDDDREQIGFGTSAADAPIVVLGPGTGLGVAALVPHDGKLLPIATEGGHVTLAAADDREAAIIAALRRTTRTGHVSAERALSGPGLANLHGAIAAVDGMDAPVLAPSDITAQATAGTDVLSTRTLDMFCAVLGGFAGDLALSYGARGGVYIAGGIVPSLIDYLAASAFRDRFEAKGRFRDYLAAVPTFVVTHPQPALLGLASR